MILITIITAASPAKAAAFLAMGMPLAPATSLITETNAAALHGLLRTTYPVSLRETELALLALRDTSWTAIAVVRGTTRNTIKTSYRQLYRKLGIHRRPDLCTLIISHIHALQPPAMDIPPETPADDPAILTPTIPHRVV